MENLTNYQKVILSLMKLGGILKCTEGENYKAWIEHKDGSITKTNRRSAVSFCEKMHQKIDYGNDGITLK